MWHAAYDATPNFRPSLFGVPSQPCDRQVKQDGSISDGWGR